MSQSGFNLPKVIAVDANFLVALISKETASSDRLRLDHLIKQIDKNKTKLVIPMPSLAEFLVKADSASVQAVNILEKQRYIVMADFNRASAFEIALIDAACLYKGDKKDSSEEAWQKVKFDRQIVAIAKSNAAQLIITRDKGVQKCATRIGMDWIEISSLEMPPGSDQHSLNFSDTVPRLPAPDMVQ